MEFVSTDLILSTALYGVRFAARACPVTRHVYWWGRDDPRAVFLDRISAEKAQDRFLFLLQGLHFSRLVLLACFRVSMRVQSQHGHLYQIVTIWTMEFAVCHELTFTPAVGE